MPQGCAPKLLHSACTLLRGYTGSNTRDRSPTKLIRHFADVPQDAETFDHDAPQRTYGITTGIMRPALDAYAALSCVQIPHAPKRDSVARGSADLAGFSDRGRADLRAYARLLEEHSLRSLAAALTTGSFRLTPGAIAPTPGRCVMMRFGGLFALAIADPAVLATRPPAPACPQCAHSQRSNSSAPRPSACLPPSSSPQRRSPKPCGTSAAAQQQALRHQRSGPNPARGYRCLRLRGSP